MLNEFTIFWKVSGRDEQSRVTIDFQNRGYCIGYRIWGKIFSIFWKDSTCQRSVRHRSSGGKWKTGEISERISGMKV